MDTNSSVVSRESRELEDKTSITRKRPTATRLYILGRVTTDVSYLPLRVWHYPAINPPRAIIPTRTSSKTPRATMTNLSDPSQPIIKSENTPENTLPDVDVEMGNATNASQQDPLAGAGAGDRIPASAPVAARKDRNLREFLGMMEEYAPIVRTSWSCSLSTRIP